MKSLVLPACFTLVLSSLTAFGAAAPTATPTAAPTAAPTGMPTPAGTLSTADRNKLNDTVKQLLVKTDPSLQDVFTKFPNYRFVPLNPAIVPTPFNVARHNGFVDIAKAGDIDVLFTGDSITDLWRNAGAGKPVFDQNFGSMKVANFGISGDTTQGVLWRLQNGEGQGYQPKAVMLMIGTNNTGGATTAGEIAEGVAAVVYELRKDFPAAKILLLAIFPRDTPGNPRRAQIAEINALISNLDDRKNVFYLDIGAKFLDENGVISRAIMGDALHPTAAGYTLWAEAVKEPLTNLVNGGPVPAKSPLPAVATPTLLAPPVAAPAVAPAPTPAATTPPAAAQQRGG